MFQLFPFFHVGGAFVVGLSLFSSGATLINASIAGGRDPAVMAAIWPIAARMDTTFLALAPASWSLVAAQGNPSARPPRLRAMLTGAAATAPELLDRIRALTGVPIIQGLGMTELCGTGAYQPADGIEREHAVGYAAPLVETRLCPISEGGPSELQVCGPMLFTGYRTADGLVRDLTDGWYASGDLGEILPDGQLRLTGRAKDVIIRGGHNIDPLGIEDAAARHPDIVMVGAVGIAGELPIVYAVRKKDASVTEAEFLAFIAEQIAVGAMHLDAVKASFDRVGGGLAESLDDAGDLVQLQRTRLGHVGKTVVHKGLGLRPNGRWRDRGDPAVKIDMADTADMPKLNEDTSALGMDSIGHCAPASDLLGRVEAGRVLITLSLLRNLRRLGDDESGAGPLRVIVRGEVARHETRAGTVPRQRCHDDAVRKCEAAKDVGAEQVRVGHCPNLSF